MDDVRAAELVPLAQGPLLSAVRRVLQLLAAALADDDAVAGRVLAHAATLPGA